MKIKLKLHFENLRDLDGGTDPDNIRVVLVNENGGRLDRWKFNCHDVGNVVSTLLQSEWYGRPNFSIEFVHSWPVEFGRSRSVSTQIRRIVEQRTK